MGDDDDERERERKKFSKHLSCRHRLSVKFLFSKNFWRQPTRRQLIEKFITFWFHFLCKFFFRAIYETNWRYYPKRYSFDGPIYANDWPFSFTFSWFDENQLNRKRWRDNRRLIGSINFFWMTIFGALFSRKIVFIMQLLFKTFPKRKIQNKNETNRLTLCLSFKKYESYSLGTGVQCRVYTPCVFTCKCCLEERKKSCETVTIVAHQTKHFQVQRTVIGEPAEGRKWFSPLRNRKNPRDNWPCVPRASRVLELHFQPNEVPLYFFQTSNGTTLIKCVFSPLQEIRKMCSFRS